MPSQMQVHKFTTMLAKHRASHHPFFTYLDQKAQTGLTVKEYQKFAINYIARTLFTIPEVAAAVQKSAMDLRSKGVTFGSLTLNEEAGEGLPENNHAMLMVRAINHHGTAIYGKKFKPVNAQKIMTLMKLFYYASEAMILERTMPKGSLLNSGGLTNTYVELTEFIDQYKRIAKKSIRHWEDMMEEFPDDANTLSKNAHLMIAVSNELQRLGVCPEVMVYGLMQQKAMASFAEGKLAGRAFAHETLADNMMLHMFKILYRDASRYPRGEAEFDNEVYPYFSAHGDYKAMLKGDVAVNEGEGVEAQHAKREKEKIAEIIQRGPNMANNAFAGAQDFADAQAAVWDGMLEAMSGKRRSYHRIA